MLNKIRDYLDTFLVCSTVVLKVGEQSVRRCWFRATKDKRPERLLQNWPNFQASHPENGNSNRLEWMNQAQCLRPHFWVYLQRDGQVTEPMMALRLYFTSTDFLESLWKSFIVNVKDEQTHWARTKVLDIPTVKGIYYLTYSNVVKLSGGRRMKRRRTLHARR